ncbi:MAG: hypothetical protein ACI4LZ_00850 [Anaerovoracaceae bacterium]
MKAKKKRTRLWSILLVLVMVVGMLPTVALAEGSQTADFTSGDGSAALALLNAAKTEGVADSVWDSSNKILTLNGVNFETSAVDAVHLPGGTTIVLADGTTNTIKGGDSGSEDCYGIYVDNGNLTIQGETAGTGKLIVNGGNATGADKDSYGIRTEKGDVTITGGTVEVTGGAAVHKSSGIYAKRNDNGSGGYIGGNINISGSAQVTASGGDVTDAKSLSYGLFANEAMTISDSAKVTATGGASSNKSYGIRVYGGNVTISGGTVYAEGGTASDDSYGIYTKGNITITDGTVTANGGTATNNSYGIYTYDDNVNISGVTVTVTAAGKSDAIKANNGSLTTSGVKTISFEENGGTGNMIAHTSSDTYTLPESGFTAPAGKQFKGWSVADIEKGASDNINVAVDTTVKAVWEDIEYTVTVTNGTASVSQAAAGTKVTLTATAAPFGKVFDKWEVVSGGITLADANSATTTFTMPAGAVSVKATYKDIPVTTYTVTVANGTASVSKAAADKTVTLTANTAPDGQVFDKWEVVSGGITLANATSATTTFTMPAGNVSVKATYKNIPTTGGGGGGYVPPVQKPIVKNDDNETTSADLKDTTSTSGGKTTANVDKAIGQEIVDKAVANESKEIVIDANAKNASAAASTVIAQISIPRDTLAAIAEKTEADVTVKNDVAEIKLDNSAAGAVAEQAAGDTIQVIVEKVAEKENKVEFQLKVVCSAGNVISDFQGGNVAVTVAIPKEMADKKVVCVYIDDNGKMSKVKGQKNEDGTYTFTTGHFSTYVLMPEKEADAAIAAQQKEETLAKLDSYELVARSAAGKTSGGKKAIKIRVYDKNGLSTDFFDGIEIYRSTKKNSGYGKKPVFVIKSGKSSYYNTAIKSGTKYYYRVRGFVMIDGQKYYTDYSLKAIRTAK